jgi:hypothetical protein
MPAWAPTGSIMEDLNEGGKGDKEFSPDRQGLKIKFVYEELRLHAKLYCKI